MERKAQEGSALRSVRRDICGVEVIFSRARKVVTKFYAPGGVPGFYRLATHGETQRRLQCECFGVKIRGGIRYTKVR